MDSQLKPWLLEVNVSPSLMGSSPLDRKIKGTLMADIFHLVGFMPYDGQAIKKDEKKAARDKLKGVVSKVKNKNLSRRQDAWRRNPSPDSIDMAELSAEDWEVIYEAEDENARSVTEVASQLVSRLASQRVSESVGQIAGSSFRLFVFSSISQLVN